jgi:2-keto-3-deoxy-galactonokinase
MSNISNRYAQRANFETTLVDVGTTSARALPANFNRAYLRVQNNGTGAIYLGFNEAATTDSLKIEAGASYEPVVAPVNALCMIGESAGKVLIVEGV